MKVFLEHCCRFKEWRYKRVQGNRVMKLGKFCKILLLHGNNIDIELCFALDQARDTRDVAPGFIKGKQFAWLYHLT